MIFQSGVWSLKAKSNTHSTKKEAATQSKQNKSKLLLMRMYLNLRNVSEHVSQPIIGPPIQKYRQIDKTNQRVIVRNLLKPYHE